MIPKPIYGFVTVLAIYSLFLQPIHAQNTNDFWRITSDQANCILTNLSSYLDAGSEIVVISVETCPETDDSLSALEGFNNYGGVTSIITTPNSGGLDRLISYTEDDLRCLDQGHVVFDDDVALLPKNIDC